MSRPHAWEDVIDDEIRRINASYAERMGLASRPALLCIDNYNAVFGDRAQPVLEAMARFPSSCGLAAWNAIEPTQRLMAAARSRGVPVIHTTRGDNLHPGAGLTYSTKRKRKGANPAWDYAHFAALAPQADELVIYKLRASAFYGTTLVANLVQMDVNARRLRQLHQRLRASKRQRRLYARLPRWHRRRVCLRPQLAQPQSQSVRHERQIRRRHVSRRGARLLRLTARR
jgi:hypothetical protein